MPVLGPSFKAKSSNSTWNPGQKETKTSNYTTDVKQTTYSSSTLPASSSSQWDTYGEQKVYYTVKMEKSRSEETKDNYGTTNTSTQYFSHRLPQSQSPTITLLKKAREGQIPKGASYIETKKEEKKYEGIGPTEKGLPIGLRTNIKDEYGTDWYRSMYNSLHKPHRTYPGAHPSGYTSEPEITSESSRRYATLDSSARLHRTAAQHIYKPLQEQEEPKPTSPPNPYLPEEQQQQNHHQEVYRNQPRSIAEYEPGHSSLAVHERLMEADEEASTLQQERRSTYGKSSGNLFRDGYESDSSVLIRKTGRSLTPSDPAQQRAWYREVQRGGEVPLGGLGKLSAPLSPQESPHKYQESEVNIHYRTPVRTVEKDYIDEQELQRRQQISMRRFYEEQKYRKKLRELEELDARRHCDYFTPSQKSPIPLDRYEHIYEDEMTPHSPEPYSIGRALFNFRAQTSRELSLQKGDIVYVLKKVDRNWYEGEKHGRIGIFPIKFVEILAPGNAYQRHREGLARVKYNFIAQTPVELSLFKGENVVLTRRVDGNWYEGRVGGTRGIFPASYVEVLAPPQLSYWRPTSPNSIGSGGGLLNESMRSLSPPERVPNGSSSSSHIVTYHNPIPYRAEYAYRPRSSDELELKTGDTIYVVEKCDDGWFVGTSLRTGLFGTFPGNYVQRIWT